MFEGYSSIVCLVVLCVFLLVRVTMYFAGTFRMRDSYDAAHLLISLFTVMYLCAMLILLLISLDAISNTIDRRPTWPAFRTKR